MLGGSLGRIWSPMWESSAPGSYALIGAAAVLAASMQAPIAATVLVLELTHIAATLTVPILFAVARASVAARWLDPCSVIPGGSIPDGWRRKPIPHGLPASPSPAGQGSRPSRSPRASPRCWITLSPRRAGRQMGTVASLGSSWRSSRRMKLFPRKHGRRSGDCSTDAVGWLKAPRHSRRRLSLTRGTMKQHAAWQRSLASARSPHP